GFVATTSISFGLGLFLVPIPYAMIIAYAGSLARIKSTVSSRVWNAGANALLVGVPGILCSLWAQPTTLLAGPHTLGRFALLLLILGMPICINMADGACVLTLSH